MICQWGCEIKQSVDEFAKENKKILSKNKETSEEVKQDTFELNQIKNQTERRTNENELKNISSSDKERQMF